MSRIEKGPSSPFKLTKLVCEKQNPKLDLKKIGYRQYDIKNSVYLDTIFLLMREEKQNHFLFFRVEDEKYCLVPWIDNVTSCEIFEKMETVSDGWTVNNVTLGKILGKIFERISDGISDGMACSCEMNPFVLVYVWSEELNKYVECDQYIK